jgi:hypothetical protein
MRYAAICSMRYYAAEYVVLCVPICGIKYVAQYAAVICGRICGTVYIDRIQISMRIATAYAYATA